METLEKSCQTCLYMATHEQCDNCLTLPGDYANFNKENGWKSPEYRYLHYKEGNWMRRIMQWEIEGKVNIVIGGQGEAEVNTKWSPEHTSKHLHYVAEQCGYMCGGITHRADKTTTVTIATAEGIFCLVWDDNKIFQSIYSCDAEWQPIKKVWDRKENEELILGMAE